MSVKKPGRQSTSGRASGELVVRMVRKLVAEPSRPSVARRDGAEVVVRMVRQLTEEQFDYWISCLNRAAAAMEGPAEPFTRDDRQKTISYWYLLMYLLELYAAEHNPFEVKKGDTWLSDGLTTMGTLSQDLRDRFKEETVRRYVFDLKQCGLIALDGRGAGAVVRVSAPAILALADTIRQWMAAFRDVDARIKKLASI